MTLMSCRRVEKLMPLYAAGDLPQGWRNRAVAAHVARCASCAALAEEFRASREWVREAAAVPEFGDDFYERLRAGVLDEINRDPRPAAPGRFAPLFTATFARPRLAYAASLTLAACAVALALDAFRGADESQGGVAAFVPPPSASVNGAAHEPSPAPTPPGAAARERQREQQPAHETPREDRRPARPAGEEAGGGFKRTPSLRRTPQAEGRAPELAMTAVTALAQQGVAPVAPRAETARVARIEIQTADPNIRIIWLAPDAGEETEPDRVDHDR
jgi:hypothetical protein